MTSGTPNWANRTLFHGDNLMFLRAMNSSSVDLIATDPPFNKGKDFHATPDSLASGARFQDRWTWKDDVHPEWVDTIKDDHPQLWAAIITAGFTHSEAMKAFCCFMGVRLLAMHRILKPSGSIYVHCDQTANSYIRMVMDAIFGSKNFRNEIVWCYTGPGNTPNGFKKKHDTILRYTKSKDFLFNADAVRVPYAEATMKRRMYAEGKGSSKGIASSYSTESRTMEEVQQQFGMGKIPEDYWNIPIVPKREYVGYPTQKPIALYERIIKASCPDGGIVLDPFAGCATTCVAAERLGMQWVGMDLWPDAGHVIEERMKKECGDGTFWEHKVRFTDAPPSRTDDGVVASAHLKTPLGKWEPEGTRMSRDEMKRQLLDEYGNKCQGCDHLFHDHRHLELDHNTPKSDGGINHISNRILLCGPCNRLKSNDKTLSGLRKANKKMGYMANQ